MSKHDLFGNKVLDLLPVGTKVRGLGRGTLPARGCKGLSGVIVRIDIKDMELPYQVQYPFDNGPWWHCIDGVEPV